MLVKIYQPHVQAFFIILCLKCVSSYINDDGLVWSNVKLSIMVYLNKQKMNTQYVDLFLLPVKAFFSNFSYLQFIQIKFNFKLNDPNIDWLICIKVCFGMFSEDSPSIIAKLKILKSSNSKKKQRLPLGLAVCDRLIDVWIFFSFFLLLNAPKLIV